MMKLRVIEVGKSITSWEWAVQDFDSGRLDLARVQFYGEGAGLSRSAQRSVVERLMSEMGTEFRVDGKPCKWVIE